MHHFIASFLELANIFLSQSDHLLEIHVPHKGLKLWSSRDGHVKSLRSEEGLEIKQVKVVEIHQICQQLICQAIQCGHHGQGELPPPICGAIHKSKKCTKFD